MKKRPSIPRIETGIRNLDAVFGGGLPRGSVSVVSGPPGSGKTILAQQICFHAASPRHRILYFNTLSEPTAKTLRYLRQFSFFDTKKLEDDFHFDDLAGSKEELRKFGYEVAVNLMAWETTALLLGEYGVQEYTTNPLFSVTDGLIALSQREASGEQQRFVQVLKLRGAR